MSDTAPTPELKKKRTLPAALAKFKFQKGHKRVVKPKTPAASQPTTPAASPKVASAAVTVRRVGLLEWLHK